MPDRDPASMSCGEPLLYPVHADMNFGALVPRLFLGAGTYPFSINFSTVPPGTGQVELEINGRWVPINLGETFDFGNFATSREIRIRQELAVVGQPPARFIIGGTPQTLVQT